MWAGSDRLRMDGQEAGAGGRRRMSPHQGGKFLQATVLGAEVIN